MKTAAAFQSGKPMTGSGAQCRKCRLLSRGEMAYWSVMPSHILGRQGARRHSSNILRDFPAASNCYLYGPVCVAESERGNGLAAMMYREMRVRLPGRTAMSFVRSDNAASLRANRKMGKNELGQFTHDGRVLFRIRVYQLTSRGRASGFTIAAQPIDLPSAVI